MTTPGISSSPPRRPTEQIVQETVEAGIGLTLNAAVIALCVKEIFPRMDSFIDGFVHACHDYPNNPSFSFYDLLRTGQWSTLPPEYELLKTGAQFVPRAAVLVMGADALKDACTIIKNSAVLGLRAIQSKHWARYCSLFAGSCLLASAMWKTAHTSSLSS